MLEKERLLYAASTNKDRINSLIKNRLGTLTDTMRSHDGENMLILILILLYLLPIWLFKYFPSQDGPAHLYNASLLREFFFSTNNIFEKYYELNISFNPTWFSHIILVVLLFFFDPLTAEKVFLTIYVVIFVVAVRYAISAINPAARWLVLLAFPLIYNYILYMGFYSCSMSYVVSFLVIGYWIRNSETWKLKSLMFFGFLSLLLYLFHIVSFAMTLGVIGVFTICSIINNIFYQKSIRRISDLIRSRIFYPFLSIIPTLIILSFFLKSKESSFYPGPELWERIKDIVYLKFIDTFQLLEQSQFALLYVLVISIPVILFLTKKIKIKFLEKNDMYFVATIACIIIYLIVPQMNLTSENGMAGGAYITERISAFPFFMAILWLATQKFPLFLKKITITSSLVLSLMMLSMNIVKTAELNGEIEEYLSAIEYTEPYKTLLSLNMDIKGYDINTKKHLTLIVDPFTHIASDIGSLHHTILLTNYEANMGYFPLLYLDEINPYRQIGRIERPMLAEINFIDYEQKSGQKIDYVLVWLGRKRNLNSKFSKSIYDQLEKKYERIFFSKNKLMELYRLKNS